MKFDHSMSITMCAKFNFAVTVNVNRNGSGLPHPLLVDLGFYVICFTFSLIHLLSFQGFPSTANISAPVSCTRYGTWATWLAPRGVHSSFLSPSTFYDVCSSIVAYLTTIYQDLLNATEMIIYSLCCISEGMIDPQGYNSARRDCLHLLCCFFQGRIPGGLPIIVSGYWQHEPIGSPLVLPSWWECVSRWGCNYCW